MSLSVPHFLLFSHTQNNIFDVIFLWQWKTLYSDYSDMQA